jgi:hypothetical protein
VLFKPKLYTDQGEEKKLGLLIHTKATHKPRKIYRVSNTILKPKNSKTKK